MKSILKPDKTDLEACKLLMKALQFVDANTAQFWFEPIKECLDYFDLPEYTCDVCMTTKMSFWDYHFAQGMCPICSKEAEEK